MTDDESTERDRMARALAIALDVPMTRAELLNLADALRLRDYHAELRDAASMQVRTLIAERDEARAERDALRAQVAAVEAELRDMRLALAGEHTRQVAAGGVNYCMECSEAKADWVRWPCPTVVIVNRSPALASQPTPAAEGGA